MATRITVRLPDHRLHIVGTDRSDGDFAVTAPGVAARRRGLIEREPTWLRLQHGTEIVAVDRPARHAGAEADGAVTDRPNAALAVTTADCLPVVLASTVGVAVVHAGWRGLIDGVVDRAVEALRLRGGSPVSAWCGPSIGPDAYEFSESDLDEVEASLGRSGAWSVRQTAEPR